MEPSAEGKSFIIRKLREEPAIRPLRKMFDALKPRAPELRLEVEEFHGIPLLRIEGEIDHHSARDLRTAAEAILSRGDKRLLLDLNGVAYMDSGGMSLLFDMVRTVSPSGWIGVIMPNDNVHRLLDITGLVGQPAFRVFATPTEAEAAIRKDRRPA